MSSPNPSFAAESSSHPFASESSPWLDNPAFVERVERVFAEEQVSFGKGGVYTPVAVLAAWLWQSLHHESCRAAVLWLTLHCARLQNASRIDTGNYCRVRAQLPETALRRLAVETAREAESAAPNQWRWHGRCVYLVDGTTVSMPDTPENQAAYPQPKSQKPGVGFPLLRMVLLLSLATAMVHDAAFGPYAGKETGEPALFRSLLDSIAKGSIVVADRYYCSYWLVALALQAERDVVFRLHQGRNHDFRQGTPLGRQGRQVIWIRPKCPDWMRPEDYQRIPPTLSLRLVRTQVTQPGFRVRELIVLTTLDAETYSVDEVVSLYHRRWNVELDIRSIKSTMKMDVLVCKTPENVRREIWIHLLAYNLCREQAARTADYADCSPRQISLAACLQATKLHSSQPPCFWPCRRRGVGTDVSLTHQLGKERVGHRPNRFEPRAVKRRPKPHDLLNEPRHAARARMVAATG